MAEYRNMEQSNRLIRRGKYCSHFRITRVKGPWLAGKLSVDTRAN